MNLAEFRGRRRKIVEGIKDYMDFMGTKDLERLTNTLNLVTMLKKKELNRSMAKAKKKLVGRRQRGGGGKSDGGRLVTLSKSYKKPPRKAKGKWSHTDIKNRYKLSRGAGKTGRILGKKGRFDGGYQHRSWSNQSSSLFTASQRSSVGSPGGYFRAISLTDVQELRSHISTLKNHLQK